MYTHTQQIAVDEVETIAIPIDVHTLIQYTHTHTSVYICIHTHTQQIAVDEVETIAIPIDVYTLIQNTPQVLLSGKQFTDALLKDAQDRTHREVVSLANHIFQFDGELCADMCVCVCVCVCVYK